MNNCEKYRELLSAYIDGELTENEKAELLAHAAECESCAALLKEYEAVAEALRGEEEPPAELTANVMAGVRRIKIARRRTLVRRTLGVAACAVLAFFISRAVNTDVIMERAGDMEANLHTADHTNGADDYADADYIRAPGASIKDVTADDAVKADETDRTLDDSEEVGTADKNDTPADTAPEASEPADEPNGDGTRQEELPVIRITGITNDLIDSILAAEEGLAEKLEELAFSPVPPNEWTAKVPADWVEKIIGYAKKYSLEFSYSGNEAAAEIISLVLVP